MEGVLPELPISCWFLWRPSGFNGVVYSYVDGRRKQSLAVSIFDILLQGLALDFIFLPQNCFAECLIVELLIAMYQCEVQYD